jgi:large subunit ribosomal protein L10
MNKTEKQDVIGGLATRLKRSPNLYVTDFTGLPVKEITELRRRLRKAGVDYMVVKNTLAERAFSDVAVAGLDQALTGPTAIVFAGTEPVAAAKVLSDFQKEFQKLTVKAGLVEGKPVTADEVKRLAALPSRDELLAQVGGAFQAPLQGFLGAMNGLLYQWVGALEALRSQRATAA